jgi:hypothetical protein
MTCCCPQFKNQQAKQTSEADRSSETVSVFLQNNTAAQCFDLGHNENKRQKIVHADISPFL